MTGISISKSVLAASAVAMGLVANAHAGVPGYVDPTPGSASFDLTADEGYISAADGSVIYMWGLRTPDRTIMQYPGPTLIVNQGDTVTVSLTNCLDSEAAAENTSLIFPGFDVTATGGVPGAATREVAPTCNAADAVTYTFVADHAGTFLYQSGTNVDIQSEMGLGGALIVRPTGFAHRAETDIPDARPTADPTIATEDPFGYVPQTGNQIAYGAGTEFDYEYLYVLTDIDPDIHDKVRMGDMAGAKAIDGKAVYWMINGRAGPDTFFDNDVPWLPTQPYGSMTRMQPGQKVLVRTVSLGRDLHPFHTHGNNVRVVAIDGNLLSSVPGSGVPDMGFSDFTVSSIPGQTWDGLFEWSDHAMGWDIFDASTQHPVEWHQPGARTDGTHGGPIPVALPGIPDLTFGGFYSGSPYLGTFGQLPPGEGGLNMNGGFMFMWHSHNEKELVNNDIFPGGMMTMLIVEPFLDQNGDLLVIPRGSSFEKTAN